MDRVKDHGVIGFVTKENGIRLNMTSEGCWYGYPHWISPDDRKGISCKPLKILTKHRVGSWRRIGDATYNRFDFSSVVGANLKGV